MFRQSIAVALVALMAPLPASADPFVTAEFPDAPWNILTGFGWFEARKRGQSFDAEVGGRLDSIVISVYRGEHSTPYSFEFWELDEAGLPMDPPLLSQEFPATIVPQTGSGSEFRAEFRFDEELDIEAGKGYAWTIATTADSPTPHSQLIGYLSEDPPPYTHTSVGTSGGDWGASERIAYYFTAYVRDAVPVQTASWGGVKSAFVGSRYPDH